MSDEAATLPEPRAGEPDAPPAPYTKAQFSKDFLEMWKRESDKCASTIFMSLPLERPPISAEWKSAAIDTLIRLVWCRTYKDGEPDALKENLDAIKTYSADLVEKVAIEEWERFMDAFPNERDPKN